MNLENVERVDPFIKIHSNFDEILYHRFDAAYVTWIYKLI